MSADNYDGVEPNTRSFLKNLLQNPGPPIYTLSSDKARAVLSGLQASNAVQKLLADIENRTNPGGPNAKEISITIVRPQSNGNETLPVVMYFHGGRWILGGFDTHERLVKELANKANMVVIFTLHHLRPNILFLWKMGCTKW